MIDHDITFFAWGDTHFGYQQRFGAEDFRYQIIMQMNQLPGWPFPEKIGGCVETPEFVMHVGDFITGGDSGEFRLKYYQYFIRNLGFKHYEPLGNHDIGQCAATYFLQKYGNTSYSFDAKGIHFVSLNTDFDRAEQASVPDHQLQFLRDDLANVSDDTPCIFFTHSAINRMKNPEELIRLLETKKVLLCIAAHHHKTAFYKLHNLHCFDLGHCRNHPIDPEYGRSFGVVQIKGNALTALPWRWDLKDWELGQRWGNRADEPVPEIAENRFQLQFEF